MRPIWPKLSVLTSFLFSATTFFSQSGWAGAMTVRRFLALGKDFFPTVKKYFGVALLSSCYEAVVMMDAMSTSSGRRTWPQAYVGALPAGMSLREGMGALRYTTLSPPDPLSSCPEDLPDLMGTPEVKLQNAF
jgi:hypothetical protein